MAPELNQYPLASIAQEHAIGAGVFVPFAIQRLRGSGTATEVTLRVHHHDVGQTGRRERTLRLTWPADAVPVQQPAVQDHIVTEWAALGVASAVVFVFAGLRIRAVGMRGDSFDYWLSDGTRDYGLEVSGTVLPDLESLHQAKAQQLADNPYGVCRLRCRGELSPPRGDLLISFLRRGWSMSQPHGIKRDGLDQTFAVDEARKSELLLSAQMLRAQGQDEASAAQFAEAATLEEQLARRATEQGLREKSWTHRFSAASCWAQAGDFYHALAWCHDLLSQDGLPEPLRRQTSAYAQLLRNRRAQWYSELLHIAPAQPSPAHPT